MSELELLQEGLSRLPEEEREAVAAEFNRQLEALREADGEARQAERAPARLRPLGLARGKGEVPERFFEPLSEEELASWNGERAGSC